MRLALSRHLFESARCGKLQRLDRRLHVDGHAVPVVQPTSRPIARRQAGRRKQHNPRPLSQPVFRLRRAGQAFRLGALLLRQCDRGRRRDAFHAPSRIRESGYQQHAPKRRDFMKNYLRSAQFCTVFTLGWAYLRFKYPRGQKASRRGRPTRPRHVKNLT